MILETAARIKVAINAGAEYAPKNGQSNLRVTATKTQLLMWDRGSPVAFLHNGSNGTAPLRVPIERIMDRRYRGGQDPMLLTAPTNGHDLMEYLRNWIAALPKSER